MDTFFRLLRQMFFYRFHLFHYVIDAISVRIEYVCPEIGLIERREEVLRHRSHDNERDDKEYYHGYQCDSFFADQHSKDRSEFMIERLIVWIFRSVSCFGFQRASTQLSPSEMASTTNSGFTISATAEGAR